MECNGRPNELKILPQNGEETSTEEEGREDINLTLLVINQNIPLPFLLYSYFNPKGDFVTFFMSAEGCSC